MGHIAGFSGQTVAHACSADLQVYHGDDLCVRDGWEVHAGEEGPWVAGFQAGPQQQQRGQAGHRAQHARHREDDLPTSLKLFAGVLIIRWWTWSVC